MNEAPKLPKVNTAPKPHRGVTSVVRSLVMRKPTLYNLSPTERREVFNDRRKFVTLWLAATTVGTALGAEALTGHLLSDNAADKAAVVTPVGRLGAILDAAEKGRPVDSFGQSIGVDAPQPKQTDPIFFVSGGKGHLAYWDPETPNLLVTPGNEAAGLANIINLSGPDTIATEKHLVPAYMNGVGQLEAQKGDQHTPVGNVTTEM